MEAHLGRLAGDEAAEVARDAAVGGRELGGVETPEVNGDSSTCAPHEAHVDRVVALGRAAPRDGVAAVAVVEHVAADADRRVRVERRAALDALVAELVEGDQRIERDSPAVASSSGGVITSRDVSADAPAGVTLSGIGEPGNGLPRRAAHVQQVVAGKLDAKAHVALVLALATVERRRRQRHLEVRQRLGRDRRVNALRARVHRAQRAVHVDRLERRGAAGQS